MVHIIAIAGPTASGKSTLTKQIKENLAKSHKIIHLCQDDFYKPSGPFEQVGIYENWDSPSSFRLDDFAKAIDDSVEALKDTNSILIVEGILLFSTPDLVSKYHTIIYLEVPKDVIRSRRFERDAWIQNNEDYFDLVVWPQHLQNGTQQVIEHVLTTYQTISDNNLANEAGKDSKTAFHVLDGTQPTQHLLEQVLQKLVITCNTIKS